MTKDRLKELEKDAAWPNVSYSRLSPQDVNHDDQNATSEANNHSTAINVDNESTVAVCLKRIDAVRSMIDQIDELAQEVQRIHIHMLQPMANPTLDDELSDKTAMVNELAYEVSANLKQLEEAQQNRDPQEASHAQWRIKESQIFVITQRFRDTMNHYNQEATVHRERCKKIIVRELEIAGHRKTNDELEEMIENGFSGAFGFSIMIETQKAKQSLDEIEARHRDIIKLEQSIKSLHAMFVDLALLVADQGQMIDSIEHNVSKAVDYVELATGDVNTAREYQEKANKKKIWLVILLVTLVVVLCVILSIVYLTQTKFIG